MEEVLARDRYYRVVGILAEIIAIRVDENEIRIKYFVCLDKKSFSKTMS